MLFYFSQLQLFVQLLFIPVDYIIVIVFYYYYYSLIIAAGLFHYITDNSDVFQILILKSKTN